MILGEEPRYKIILYLIRIGDFKSALKFCFWRNKKWFSSNEIKTK